MRTTALLVMTGLALAGCATPSAQHTPPAKEEWKPDPIGQDYGRYPTNYEEIVKPWYQTHLKDPDSAKFVSFSKPRKENAVINVDKKEAAYGYSTCVSVNAKNSYGGYTGAQTTWFLIRNDQIVTTRDMRLGIIYRGHPINCADGEQVLIKTI